MLGIYANSFMTATRTGCTKVRDLPASSPPARKRRWLPEGHWWLGNSRCIDLDRL
jgi:hypothetical protein